MSRPSVADVTPVRFSRLGRDLRQLPLTREGIRNMGDVKALQKLGIFVGADPRQGFAMDDAQGLNTTPSVTTPVQFLQTWLPGTVRVATQVRLIDELVGIDIAGAWEDEEIVQPQDELVGQAAPYGDYTPPPQASWNQVFERRTVVPFVMGAAIGVREEARAARVRVNGMGIKREGAARALDIQRNRVGFYGYNASNQRTYGMLNDPGMIAYVALPNNAGGTSTKFADKTFLEMTADFKSTATLARVQSGGLVDFQKQPSTIAIALSARDALSTPNVQGTRDVEEWIRTTYPQARIIAVPEFDAANGGANVMYWYADSIGDTGTDNGAVIAQIVQTKFMALGVRKDVTQTYEGYTNATAGVLCKRPFGLVRRTGC